MSKNGQDDFLLILVSAPSWHDGVYDMIRHRINDLYEVKETYLYKVNNHYAVLLRLSPANKECVRTKLIDVIRDRYFTSLPVGMKFYILNESPKCVVEFFRKIDFLHRKFLLPEKNVAYIDVDKIDYLYNYYLEKKSFLDKNIGDWRNSICFFVQPIVNKNFDVQAYEILTRIKDKDSDIIVPPSDFFFVLDREPDLLLQFEEAVLLKALIFNRERKRKDLKLHLNLSPFFVVCYSDTIIQVSRREMHNIVIEITENKILFDRYHDLIDSVRLLCSNGCTVILDDFGEGANNIISLIKVPVKGIKISRNLAMHYILFSQNRVEDNNLGTEEERTAIIVRHLINLCSELVSRNSFEVYIEGIETYDDFQRCKSLPFFNLFQGFFVNKPFPVEMSDIYGKPTENFIP